MPIKNDTADGNTENQYWNVNFRSFSSRLWSASTAYHQSIVVFVLDIRKTNLSCRQLGAGNCVIGIFVQLKTKTLNIHGEWHRFPLFAFIHFDIGHTRSTSGQPDTQPSYNFDGHCQCPSAIFIKMCRIRWKSRNLNTNDLYYTRNEWSTEPKRTARTCGWHKWIQKWEICSHQTTIHTLDRIAGPSNEWRSMVGF